MGVWAILYMLYSVGSVLNIVCALFLRPTGPYTHNMRTLSTKKVMKIKEPRKIKSKTGNLGVTITFVVDQVRILPVYPEAKS